MDQKANSTLDECNLIINLTGTLVSLRPLKLTIYCKEMEKQS